VNGTLTVYRLQALPIGGTADARLPADRRFARQ
jgi:hypothetical protein